MQLAVLDAPYFWPYFVAKSSLGRSIRRYAPWVWWKEFGSHLVVFRCDIFRRLHARRLHVGERTRSGGERRRARAVRERSRRELGIDVRSRAKSEWRLCRSVSHQIKVLCVCTHARPDSKVLYIFTAPKTDLKSLENCAKFSQGFEAVSQGISFSRYLVQTKGVFLSFLKPSTILELYTWSFVFSQGIIISQCINMLSQPSISFSRPLLDFSRYPRIMKPITQFFQGFNSRISEGPIFSKALKRVEKLFSEGIARYTVYLTF